MSPKPPPLNMNRPWQPSGSASGHRFRVASFADRAAPQPWPFCAMLKSDCDGR